MGVLPNSTLIGDKAYCDAPLQEQYAEQGTTLCTPCKKPKKQELTELEKYYNRLVSRLRQLIESFFNWLINKTDSQTASTVRSTEGLMLHCFGKPTFAFYPLVSTPDSHITIGRGSHFLAHGSKTMMFIV